MQQLLGDQAKGLLWSAAKKRPWLALCCIGVILLSLWLGLHVRIWKAVTDRWPALKSMARAPSDGGKPVDNGAEPRSEGGDDSIAHSGVLPMSDGMPVKTLQDEVHIGSPACPPRFEVRGIYPAKFVSCYDGDTCDVVLMMPRTDASGYKLRRFRARTVGYNAPEIKQPVDAPDRDIQKQMAVASRERLWKLVTGLPSTSHTQHSKLVIVKVDGYDKYGRILVHIYETQRGPGGELQYDASKTINANMLRWLGPKYAMDDKGRMVHKQESQ